MTTMTDVLPFLPYPPIEQHGVIGDRRTAALVAADGTIDWLCLPNYDGASIFGALLDAEHGGFWRIGPATPTAGRQRYLAASNALITAWECEGGTLEVTDALLWPETSRQAVDEERRVVLRRVRCCAGAVEAAFQLVPRRDFDTAAVVTPSGDGFTLKLAEATLGLWASGNVTAAGNAVSGTFTLTSGDEIWAVLAWQESPEAWSIERARSALDASVAYWHAWSAGLTYTGPRKERILRSALTVHLLSFAPSGSLVAAPTTSLPERIGGDRNYDYRFAWVRDASLSMASLAMLGNTQAAQAYMDWLAQLNSVTDAPLQVAYGIDGRTDLTQHERTDLAGYRGALPIRFGNHAYAQRQLDSLGYLAECALIYLQHGGTWKSEYWELIRRIADYTAANWQQPDSGIWELSPEQHYVSSKVMSWVTLERALQIAVHLGLEGETETWRSVMTEIHADVMTRGWSAELNAFRQRYEADTLDASVLLIPVMGFLPADHPRVLATVERIEAQLTIDRLVHRFDARTTPGTDDLPVGEFEGAFLPCTFWLATTYSKAGQPDKAEAILQQAEVVAGELGLFAEEIDARRKTFLGNTPLLFAQVEYVRAVMELAQARPLDKARLMLGQAQQRITRLLNPDAGSGPDA